MPRRKICVSSRGRGSYDGRAGKPLTKEIAKLLGQEPSTLYFPGKHWGWKISSVPTAYLEWMVNEITALEHRDQAETELFRRRQMTPRCHR